MRTGKIARLPDEIREELNERLLDGEEGQRLLQWLNELPEVREVLESEFNGTPIRAGNLTLWVQGGFEDWKLHQDALDWRDTVREQAEELNPEGTDSMGDDMAAVLSVELSRAAKAVLADKSDPMEHFERLAKVLKHVDRLRKSDHQAIRLRLKATRQKWEIDVKRKTMEHAAKEKRREQDVSAFEDIMKRQSLTEELGGNDLARRAAAIIIELKNNLTPGMLRRPEPSESEEVVQAPVEDAVVSEKAPNKSEETKLNKPEAAPAGGAGESLLTSAATRNGDTLKGGHHAGTESLSLLTSAPTSDEKGRDFDQFRPNSGCQENMKDEG